MVVCCSVVVSDVDPIRRCDISCPSLVKLVVIQGKRKQEIQDQMTSGLAGRSLQLFQFSSLPP